MSDTRKDELIDWLKDRNPHETEYLQAVEEVLDDIVPFACKNEKYLDHAVLKRLCEPERIVSFRVVWEDDDGEVHVNRGIRVQHSNAIGPYKGGIRFHPTVNQSILKFLAFEQTFKNALTGLPMGSGKGGADFDPSDRSDREIMRFCQAFMQELFRHIGPNTDVPAGDINVGSREIGYLYGQYKKLTNSFSGALTGKGMAYGGSPVRPEATGFGVVYFLCHMLEKHNDEIDGKRIVISGAGNVAIHAAMKAAEMGAKPITLSNSDGYLFCEDGFSHEDICKIKESDKRLEDIADDVGGTWHGDDKPWAVECDCALPCATQNELDEDDAQTLCSNGVVAIAEGANMPCTSKAKAAFRDSDILFAPGKASNAGGVALSGLEMSQNAAFETAERDQLGERLQTIMCEIHDRCVDNNGDDDRKVTDYTRGANIAGFRKVADAMLSFGVV